MRHRVAGRHLGRNAAQRRALFRNLVRELYLHERIITTEAKARSIRSDAERLITKAKKGASAADYRICLLYTSPSPRDRTRSRMPSSA